MSMSNLAAILSIALSLIVPHRAVALEQGGSKPNEQSTSTTNTFSTAGQNCYMQTPNGKVTYFSFCDRQATPQRNPIQNSITPPTKPTGKVVLFVSDLEYKGNWLVGRVTNAGNRQADRVRVYWEVLDRFGEVVGADYSCASPPTILPGRTVTFRDFVYPEGSTVRTTAIAWGPDGATVASLFPASRSGTIYYRRQGLVQVFKTNQLKLTQCSLYSSSN